MQSADTVNQLYLKYGMNEAACAKEYNSYKTCKTVQREVKKIAVYYSAIRFGGVGRVISLMLPIYMKLGYRVILITEEVSENDYNIPREIKHYIITDVKNIKCGIKTFKTRIEEMEHILVEEKVDLYIHHGVHMPFFTYDIILANLLGIYTVAERHQVFSEEFCRFQDLFSTQKEALKIVDKLVVLSNIDTLYWKSLGIDAVYIENPFNTELININRSYCGENIVWIGRLESNQKQYLDVLKIAKIVIARKPHAKFLMYGSGTDENVAKLHTKIFEEELYNNVFYCGYEKNIYKIYENAKIHLVTSAYEAFPMGIFESRICGIPLVMYDLPYLELLKSEKGYLSSDNGDVIGMANNICVILDDNKIEKTLQIEAKESVKGFNNSIVCDKWKKLFNALECGDKELNGNEQFGIIIQTMHKHFSIAQKQYKELLFKYEQQQIIFNVSKGEKKGKKIVLCPYGKVGKKVKKIINQNEIYETYILDNLLSKSDKRIKSFETIKEMDCSELFFVICSTRNNVRQMLYEQINKLVDSDNITFFDDEITNTHIV